VIDYISTLHNGTVLVSCVQRAIGSVQLNARRLWDKTPIMSVATRRLSPGTDCWTCVIETPSGRRTVRPWWRCGGSTWYASGRVITTSTCQLDIDF